MARVHEKLGSIWQDYTPQFDLYKDKTKNKQTFPLLKEELEPTPELTDNYIGVAMLLPKGAQWLEAM